MIRVLSSNVLAWERKAQLADEGLWFSCLLSGTKKKKVRGGGVQADSMGQRRKTKRKKTKHKDVFRHIPKQ